MPFQDYSGVPAQNTQIGDDIFIGPNMERAKVRPSLQQLAADGRNLYDALMAGGAGLPVFTASGSGAVPRPANDKLRETVSVADFGASPSASAAANSAAFMAAIASLRRNPTTLTTDGLNGGTFTAYSSGELLVGEGVFPIAPDVIQLTQDLGLIIRGKGSRKTNLSVLGRTVLLVTGNGQFGIQVKGNGARGLVLEDLDLTYPGNTFTGDLLDNFGAPGMVVNRCHIGTHGITGATRYRSARSCVRTTYDEFQHFLDTTFDGAVDGWWSDDTRNPPTGPTNEFGGSRTLFTSCVFYDFDGDMIRHDGNRNRKGLTIHASCFNPISFNCVRSIDLNNVDGFSVDGCNFSASVDSHATAEWFRFTNCTGKITDNWLGDFSPIGTVLGSIHINNNFFGGSTGITITGGCVTGAGNEFSAGATADPTAFTIAPTAPLTFRLGPDVIKAGFLRSYDIPSDSSNLDGHIIYSPVQDAATSKFRNVSARVTIRANDAKCFTISTTPYSPGREDTGRTIRNDNAGAAVFTLPAIGTPGLEFTFVNDGGSTMEIRGPSAGTLFVGGGAAKVSALAASGDVGASITVKSLTATGYHVISRNGGWSFS